MSHASAKRISFAVILVCALTSGCATRPVYHASWAEQVKVESGACPVIDGEYQNAGQRYTHLAPPYHRYTVSLAHLLNGWNDAEGRKVDVRPGNIFAELAEDAYQTVSLRLVEGKLHIEASLAGGSTRTFDLPTLRRCRDSTVLLLEADWDRRSSFDVDVVSRSTLALGRAEDGSLLVRESRSNVSFVFVVPIEAETFADWTRFPPVAPAPAQL